MQTNNNSTIAKKKYNLVGVDGNAFCVMGYVARAMRAEGFSREEIKAYQDDAMSADYSHLICVSIDKVDECNDRAKKK